MGDDNRVVDAARVSFSKIASNYTEDQNARLIKYLASHGHTTPFTHPMICMKEKVPIFIARQRFKHTVGFTYNEVSRRYVDDEPEFHVPDVWRKRADNKKQGSTDEEVKSVPMYPTEGMRPTQRSLVLDSVYKEFIADCTYLYKRMIDGGVAPEQARMVLPQSMFTEYYVTGSLSAWARAYKLRIDSHAQKEIQDLAVQWDAIIRPLFPLSWAALVD